MKGPGRELEGKFKKKKQQLFILHNLQDMKQHAFINRSSLSFFSGSLSSRLVDVLLRIRQKGQGNVAKTKVDKIAGWWLNQPI